MTAPRLTIDPGGLAPRRSRTLHARGGPAMLSATVIDDDDAEEPYYADALSEWHASWFADRAIRHAEAEAHAEWWARHMQTWADESRQLAERRERFRRREGRAERVAREYAVIDRFVAEEAEDRAKRLTQELALIDHGEPVSVRSDAKRGLYCGPYLGRDDGLRVQVVAADGRVIASIDVVGSVAMRSQTLEFAWQLLALADPEAVTPRLAVLR